MENLKNLAARYWPTASLLLIGLILIVYIALGFIYFQQGPQQKELQDKINQLTLVLSRELPSAEELEKARDEVNTNLAPLDAKDSIAVIVDIAEKNGIDVAGTANKLLISSAGSPQPVVVGGSTYMITIFNNIQVQGPREAVMAFVTDLDSGITLPNMVLTKLILSDDIQIPYAGEEGARRAELRAVQAAFDSMMEDNGLTEVPNPFSFAGNQATNLMGDDPETEDITEGFPDTSTSAFQKGYTGDGSPRNGYVLYEHNKILNDDPTDFEAVSYFSSLTTDYYYTCESDGTIRQWDRENILNAEEFSESEESSFEMKVTLDLSIYTKDTQ